MALKKGDPNRKHNEELIIEGKKIVLTQILEYLKDSCGCKSYRELAPILNVKSENINNWKSAQSSGKRAIEKLIKTIVSHSLKISYEPIAELTPVKLDGNDSMIIGKNTKEQEELKRKLEAKQGIYLFYDSLGRALYAGKTSSQTLWKELGSAFSRERKVQKLYKYNNKQIRKSQYYLYEVAHYVSAYAVHRDAIKDFEALIIRAFPNDLTNVRMEKKALSFDNKNTYSKKKMVNK